jgi:putative isomerase
LAGLDHRDIAYSNLFQVVKSKAAAGFVPNWSTGGAKSQDRTEPPVGGKVMLELYNKYNETWPIEVVFDDLLDWHNWFLQNRILQPAGLVALGSYFQQYEEGTDSAIDGFAISLGETRNTMQAARFESGLDNSPMYDGNMFDNQTTHLMQLYDVGMSSLYVQEAYALAQLADILGRDRGVSTMLRSRGDAMRDKISQHLWDPSQQIFVNRYPNGTFAGAHVSPTSFYPMMTGGASEEQVNVMVQSWLFNASRFCISPDGNFTGNNPSVCYWGLPSISADDPAYLQGQWIYWRGYVWGPMSQLLYWSLSLPQNTTSNLQVVDEARKALCQQMEALMMSQWNAHRHICENYHPHRSDAADCTGTKFYSWGALHGLIGMVEEGFWNK